MSQIVTTVVYDGIIMAADSATSKLKFINGEVSSNPNDVLSGHIVSRSIQKLHTIGNNIGVSESHQWTLEYGKSIKPYLSKFYNDNNFSTPIEAAEALMKYVQSIDSTIDARFNIAGYEPQGNGLPVPMAYVVEPKTNEITRLNEPGLCGIMWLGVSDWFAAHIQKINLGLFSMQDAIDISTFIIDGAIKLNRFQGEREGVCLPIDVLAITQNGIEWVKKKSLKSEY